MCPSPSDAPPAPSANPRRIVDAGRRFGQRASSEWPQSAHAGGAARPAPNPHAMPRLRDDLERQLLRDRKSTRLNSSHANISYAVFCLKKKETTLRRFLSLLLNLLSSH